LRERPRDDGKLARFILLIVPGIVAIVSLASTAVGYAQFGHYVFSNALATAAVLFLAWAARGIAAEVLQRVCDVESPAGHVLADRIGADQAALRLVQFWLGLMLDLAVPAVALLALMVVWGTGTEDAFLLTERLVDGIRVGNVTLSLADLVAAIVTFVVGVWLTRLSQRILDRRVFPGTQLDLGVRNSLRSGLGYIGVIIAGAIAILALGINLSNLALVAGALSVGIGFGLQNIINNFVSGLILLIERPVKVGDWITVSGNDGVVNRINVRSTEIITSSRASVLIPNADFLSASVTNWTLKDKGGRLHLTFRIPGKLGAAGGRDLLLASARSVPKVQSHPEPRVLLQDIGDTYTFELEADVGDATTMREVASDLRYAVDAALRKAVG
jgi:small-conductance mechanosensitive channel